MAALEWMIRYGAQLGAGLVAGAALLGASAPRARVLLAARRQGWRGPLPPVSERSEGSLAVVEGTLRVLDGPCSRVEDGAPAAAVTFLPRYEGPLPRQERAGSLALDLGGETVPLLGPVLVDVGSHEWWPGLLPRWWPSRARPHWDSVLLRALTPRLSLSNYVFRSVQDGDRVRVAGVWTRDGASAGYRSAGGFCLAPASGRIGGPPPALRVAALATSEVRGPAFALTLAGVVLGAAVAVIALAALGRAAMSSGAPTLALATPSRPKALRQLRASAEAPIRKGEAERRLAGALWQGEDCAVRGRRLYEQGSLDEAAALLLRCGAGEAAAAVLYELTEWERASDALETAHGPISFDYAPSLAPEIHLLAGHPERALKVLQERSRGLAGAFLVPPGLSAVLDQEANAVRCVEAHLRKRDDASAGLAMAACACPSGPLLAATFDEEAGRLGAERTYLDRVYRLALRQKTGASLQKPEDCAAAPRYEPVISAPRLPEKSLILAALAPQNVTLSWPVGLLLPSASELLQQELFQGPPEALRPRLELLASQAERLALYSALAGRDDDARSWAQRARMADEQLARYAPPREGPSGGDLLVAVVDLDQDRYLAADNALRSSFPPPDDRPPHFDPFRDARRDHPLAALGRFLSDNEPASAAVLDVLSRFEDGCEEARPPGKTPWYPGEVSGSLTSGTKLAHRFDCARAGAYASLPLLSARVRLDQADALRAYAERPREQRQRTLLDLLAEAHDEIMLRRRLGLPDPDHKAELRRQRIDDKLRDRDLAVLLDLLESARLDRGLPRLR